MKTVEYIAPCEWKKKRCAEMKGNNNCGEVGGLTDNDLNAQVAVPSQGGPCKSKTMDHQDH